MSYTDVFGGGPADPSDVQYRALSLTASVELFWPSSNEDQPEVVARLMDITPSGGTWTITMPPANEAATGQNVVMRNFGSLSFNVVDNAGGAIATIASGESKYIYVTGNSTAAGTWAVFTFGTGTSGADASTLAGAGLQASAATLRQALMVTTIAASYTANVNDRATVLEYTGGVGTLTLTAAATLGNNWFVYVNNQGTGTLTVDPNSSETIDGDSTIGLLPDESCMIVCDGTNFVTIGRGRSSTFVVTASSINVAGSGTSTLSSAQAAAQVQNYTGLLTGNRTINYGTAPGYWFVTNSTTGAYSLTLRVNSSDTGVTLASGSSGVFKSDGTNLISSTTAASGTVTSVATGTGLTGGPITTTGTISLANTAVTPGSYTVLGATVDAQGRITSGTDVSLTATNYLASQRGTPNVLTASGTIFTPIFTSGNNWQITVSGSMSLANPTSVVAGQAGQIAILGNAAGNQALSFGSFWKFAGGSAPTLSTTASAQDLLSYYTVSSGIINANLLKAFA